MYEEGRVFSHTLRGQLSGVEQRSGAPCKYPPDYAFHVIKYKESAKKKKDVS